MTIAAIVAVLAILAAGLVQLATLADLLGAPWQWPAWMTLTGGAAFWSIRRLHDATDERTPEGIADRSARKRTPRRQTPNHAAKSPPPSPTRSAPTPTPGAPTQPRAPWPPTPNWRGSPPSPSRRQLAAAISDQSLDAEHDADLVYATSIPRRARRPDRTGSPRRRATGAGSTRTPCAALAAAPPPAPAQQPPIRCWSLCWETISALFADCAQRGDDLIVGRLPWSARGDWPAESKRVALAALARLDPPLIEAGAGGRYRLNRRAWCHPIALTAIRHHWRQ